MPVLPQLPRRGDIDPELYDCLRRIIEYQKSLRPVQSLNTLTSHTAIGVSRQSSAKSKAGPAAGIRGYDLLDVNEDDYTCDDGAGGEVTILKPYQLQRTPFDHQTISYTVERWPLASVQTSITYTYKSNTYRTAVQSGSTEDQVIIPRYRIGISVIYAMENEDGDLIDLNVDARAWAAIV